MRESSACAVRSKGRVCNGTRLVRESGAMGPMFPIKPSVQYSTYSDRSEY